MHIRLNKAIADKGICSRRKADELIRDGKIMVNGKLVEDLSTKVDPEKDDIQVKESLTKQAKTASINTKKIYIAMNKPIDFICSASSDQGASVLELLTYDNTLRERDKSDFLSFADKNTNLRDIFRVYPVGRLDKDSEGLVLLTNDGELTNQLTHPRYEHEKEYELHIDDHLSKDAVKVLEKGMQIDDEWVKGIQIASEKRAGRRYFVRVILQEGKNRQLRKMFGRLGYNIHVLRRIRMGKLKLGSMPQGKWKFVSKKFIV